MTSGPGPGEPYPPLIVEDRARGRFQVHRRTFTDDGILERERHAIFDASWLYLGHVSEVAAPGDFLTRRVAGRPLVFNRDRAGRLHAFHNSCSHRGAMICRVARGSALSWTCPYHAWAYDDEGRLIQQPGPEAYPPGMNADRTLDLPEVRLAEAFGFVFVNLSGDAPPLPDFLGGMLDILELVSQTGEHGMEVVGTAQDYVIRANWKLLHENSADAYHGASTHATYFQYIAAREGGLVTRGGGQESRFNVRDIAGWVADMGGGHVVSESLGALPWGRPVARWIPSWGAAARAELERVHARLVERLGEARGTRIAHGDRNTLFFPNLVINDIMAVTIRTFFPLAPDQVEVATWCLAPVGEAPAMRERRMRSYLEFFGPAGFATPDDIEMLELCQQGYANRSAQPWNDVSRGLLTEHERADKLGELQMRVFWRRWNALMTGAAACAR